VVVAQAVAGAAARLEGGFGADGERREERMRRALAIELEDSNLVSGVCFEWRPEMAFWPPAGPRNRLGGFDLALAFSEDEDFSVVAECKWCTHTGIDTLDEVPWDWVKLAHAEATLPGVRWALLLYAAPLSAWAKPARFTSLFEESLVSTRELIAQNEGVWRWLLRQSAKSRPKRLPPYIQTSPSSFCPPHVRGQATRNPISDRALEREPLVRPGRSRLAAPGDRASHA
jgi:hypothetical protein